MIVENLVFSLEKKGTISADHNHPDPETIYLVSGEIELTIGKETKRVQAPIMFTIGSNIYHKLIALTDIALVLDRDNK